jgi:DNA-binding transcriptional MerR regulator
LSSIIPFGGNTMSAFKFKTFSIGDTARMTGGVSQKQIRNWEARGYIPKAARLICGDRAYRRFTKLQIEVIKKIKKYLDQGYTLAKSAELAKI